jgi:peptide/nickel transport system substrate-binding protein
MTVTTHVPAQIRGRLIDVKYRFRVVAAAIAALALVATVAGTQSSGVPAASAAGADSGVTASLNNYNPDSPGSAVKGGTVTWSFCSGCQPIYIFPMQSEIYMGSNNAADFAALMYRPLYWFGNNDQPTIDYDYSIGLPPVYSDGDRTVTITLKSWKWSDGEQVTSEDVALWIALYKADPSVNYFGYVAPASNGEKFFPDNVASIDTPNASTVVLHLTQSYNPTWFTDDELSQITPLPMAWDASSVADVGKNESAPVNIDDKVANEAVYQFLSTEGKNSSSWVGSPLWSVVDGPFKLAGYSSTGTATLVPNPSYSGSPEPSIGKLVEETYTDNSAELTALKTEGPSGLTVGFLPPEDASQDSSLEAEGYANRSTYMMAFTYFALNFNNPVLGPTFRQLYFRQALQHLVNQPGDLTAFEDGWGQQTVGPLPPNPPGSFSDSNEQSNPYPYSVSAAKALLSQHGWTVREGGVTTCTKPGTGASECGAGVKEGTALEFNLDYISGTPSVEGGTEDLQASASQVGIKIDLTSHEFSTVIGAAVNCQPTQSDCKWTAEDWGGGYYYSPGDFYPSGQPLFMSNASNNVEGWNDPKTNDLIEAITTAAPAQLQSDLDAYQDYIIKELPLVFQPTAFGDPFPGGVAVISKKLGGVVPNAYSFITPEAWHFNS